MLRQDQRQPCPALVEDSRLLSPGWKDSWPPRESLPGARPAGERCWKTLSWRLTFIHPLSGLLVRLRLLVGLRSHSFRQIIGLSSSTRFSSVPKSVQALGEGLINQSINQLIKGKGSYFVKISQTTFLKSSFLPLSIKSCSLTMRT